jgi:RNA polymerase sigma-70 factor (ECF subfamily)
MIQSAAAGNDADREEFVKRYSPVVRDYLAARWKSPSWRTLVDDGVQDVFVECFRSGGILSRADANRPGGFRPFLFAVVRNVALRIETKQARRHERERRATDPIDLDEVPATEEGLSKEFDRAWAKALVGRAATLMMSRARSAGDGALRRANLLKLRFFDGLPIREVAKQWAVDPAALHHDYARARNEFRSVLEELVAFEHPGRPEEVREECRALLSLLNRA